MTIFYKKNKFIIMYVVLVFSSILYLLALVLFIIHICMYLLFFNKIRYIEVKKKIKIVKI